VPNLATCACGEGPVLVAMMTAKKLGANHATVLKYANSGDTPFGDRDQVVGYAAVVFWRGEGNAPAFVAPTPAPVPAGSVPLTEEDRQTLLRLARQTLAQFLADETVPWHVPTSPGLLQERGIFVTLTRHGQLRGCRGNLVGGKPLYLGVQQMSIASALEDPRFPPVAQDELDELQIEISVLGPLESVADMDGIQVGVHGLVIVKGDKQGVLLPQVPVQEGWDRAGFLEGLCRKAELPAGCWRQGAQLYSFTAEVFGEER
jgi:AmmeMemoRadiSam system protein A